ncbi:hypothetical protein BCR44DRAFT_44205 [Catenaria anguillulae PL171]|uniref:Uncharacterized protein n=1 Tax=Catenaria anguillulae PL171 TaxID=765915 RepID=A0A1Y2HZJ0_9FUNG|nr:hypothetical protein BCR44DRAFT_44205 [Catenaria anguillulae PL171]
MSHEQQDVVLDHMRAMHWTWDEEELRRRLRGLFEEFSTSDVFAGDGREKAEVFHLHFVRQWTSGYPIVFRDPIVDEDDVDAADDVDFSRS